MKEIGVHLWIVKMIFFLNVLAPKTHCVSVVQLHTRKCKMARKNKKKNTIQTAEETVKLAYFFVKKKEGLQAGSHSQLFLQHSLESY